MPQTVPDGFWWEQDGDQPGHSLRDAPGTPSGDVVLAEQVQTVVTDLRGDISAADDRLTVIENEGILGWTYVTHGSGSGQSVSVDLTRGGVFAPGDFDLLRVHVFFANDGNDWVSVRVNGIGEGHYLTGSLVWDSLGNLDEQEHVDGKDSWVIGWGGVVRNNLTCEIFDTDGGNPWTYRSTSERNSTSEGVHQWGQHWGMVSPSSGSTIGTPASLALFPGTATTTGTAFNAVRWWVEGFRTP